MENALKLNPGPGRNPRRQERIQFLLTLFQTPAFAVEKHLNRKQATHLTDRAQAELSVLLRREFELD